MPSHSRAFSLVELSIVLVILGLLTGGILTGASLIRAAELRSVTTNYTSFQTAVMTFRSKYFALPGDMTNATDFWGEMTNCGAASPSGSGTQTCNGDGDGSLDLAPASQTGELFAFWQQLANAGLLEGSYTGISGSGSTSYHLAGTNAPRGKISASCWGIGYWGNLSANATRYDGSYGNIYQFGLQASSGHCGSASGTEPFRAEEQWNIDKKVDDGHPAYGNVVSQNNTKRPNCVTTDSSATTAYDLSNSDQGCTLIMVSGF